MARAIKKQALGGLSALLKDPENDIKSVDDKSGWGRSLR
jgi:ParB family chromosome partitioning protein